jgi:predicted DNA-binding WGR domain protein
MSEFPTRLVDWTVDLEAVDPSQNIARRYRIATSIDLFGHMLVSLEWGRKGRRGQSLTLSFEREDAALGFIRRVLARRSTARRRLGVPYVVAGSPGRQASDLLGAARAVRPAAR